MEGHEHRETGALTRYQVISAYLAMDPPRGQRCVLLQQLASRAWAGPDGEPFQVAAETIRTWVRRYRRGGLAGLEDKPRPVRGTKALGSEVIERAVELKRQVPERSLDRLIRILEGLGEVEPGTVRRSTLHRALQARGLSRPQRHVPDARDLDRFEADGPNDLWQSDMLVGPWLPDPARPGKVRRAYLYAFLDDHSRALLHGRFSFKGDLPALELVFRRSIQRYGQPTKVYYDNGQTYRSRHMKQIVATLGIHRIVFTQPYRPMGHGKIEAFNRLVRNAFLAELKASPIRTLDELNEAFLAWADVEYNAEVHGETGETPLDRWRAGIQHVRYADDERIRQAFLWRERRTPDKSGLFTLFGRRYQVSAELSRRRIELRYDPEALDELEAWSGGRFVERVRPFRVHTHRRPQQRTVIVPQEPPAEGTGKRADWLGHLVVRRDKEHFVEPTPRQLAELAQKRRQEADRSVCELLRDRLDPDAFLEDEARDYLARFGPFDAARAQRTLERLFDAGDRRDLHVRHYLDAIRNEDKGGPR